MTRFQHVLVTTDFSPTARRAVEMAADLAKQYGAALTLLHVVEIPAYAYSGLFAPIELITPVRRAAEQALEGALAELQKEVPKAASLLRSGDAADEIIAAVHDTGADLVVVGTHGRRGVSHMLLGSVAERIVRASRAPVLTVRGDA